MQPWLDEGKISRPEILHYLSYPPPEAVGGLVRVPETAEPLQYKSYMTTVP